MSKRTKEEPLKITVPLSEVLEILRLAGKIETPIVVYRRDGQLEMATEAVEKSMAYASAIAEILYKWTHNNEAEK